MNHMPHAHDQLPAQSSLIQTGLLQRTCACGGGAGPSGTCAECRRNRLAGVQPLLQPKLALNHPGDRYEQEADRLAEQVMRMPAPAVQRQVEPEEEEEAVQASPISGQAAHADLSPALEGQINALHGGGQPLDPGVRAFMEPRFSHDFSRVRVHSGSRAASLARTLKARAFTVGQDVVFGAGKYAPDTLSGGRLLAHELAHTIQQSTSYPATMYESQAAPPHQVYEPMADAAEHQATSSHTAQSGETAAGCTVQREDETAPIESERETNFDLRLDPDLIQLSLELLRGEHRIGAEAGLTDPVSIPLDLLGIDLGIDSSRLNAILRYDNRCNRAFQAALVELQAGPFIGVNRVPWTVTPRVGVRIGSLRFDPGVGLGFEGSEFRSVLFTLNLAAASTEIPPDCFAPPSRPPQEPEIPGAEPERPAERERPPGRRPPPGTPTRLPTYTLYFFYDSTLLRPESEDHFQRMLELLNAVPGLRIHLTGHTSLEGTERYNQRLSERRANAVRDRLVIGGIDAGRIDVWGMGETAPAVIEPSIPRRSLHPAVEEVRTLNRRVEVGVYDPTGQFEPGFPSFRLTSPGPAPSPFSSAVPRLRLER
jgi:outer membrane protein OmpA-like peptidoglycan-associated protein